MTRNVEWGSDLLGGENVAKEKSGTHYCFRFRLRDA